MEHDCELLGHGDDEGARHFLRAVGGMGSLNDLTIHASNGGPISPDQVDRVSEQLRTPYD